MATSTISNTLLKPNGTAATGIQVVITLMPSGGFRADTFTEVVRVVTATTDSNGLWSIALERNTNITPSGTFYVVDERLPASMGGPVSWAIQVGASNQTVQAALISNLPAFTNDNFLTQEAADARYQALSSIGTDTPTTIAPDDAASAGVSTAASRGDHRHAIVAAAPSKLDLDGSASAAEGVSTSFARADHQHTAENDAWTSYTPTLTQSGAVTKTVNVGKWIRIGRTIIAQFDLTCTGAGTGNNEVLVGLPVTAAALVGNPHFGAMMIYDASTTTRYNGNAEARSTTTVALSYNQATAAVWGVGPNIALASGDILRGIVTYEAAT